MTEMEYERDREYMKEMYPNEAKKIQEAVEEECDKLEYEGSLMFDEYPDRAMLRRMCEKIYQQIYEDKSKEQELETMQYRPGCSGPGCGRNLIEVLLYNEMYRRRCRHGRCRRWW